MRWFFCFKKVIFSVIFQKLKSKRKRGGSNSEKISLNKLVDKELRRESWTYNRTLRLPQHQFFYQYFSQCFIKPVYYSFPSVTQFFP